MEGLKIVIEAVKANPGIKKLIYTSSFFALGPTDGYIADESQVRSIPCFSPATVRDVVVVLYCLDSCSFQEVTSFWREVKFVIC